VHPQVAQSAFPSVSELVRSGVVDIADGHFSFASEESGEPTSDTVVPEMEYHAVEVGAGRSIVLFHDLFSSQKGFDPICESLSDDWRCMALDLPGHGASSPLPPDRETTDLLSFVEELVDVLTEFAVLPAALVGHGTGGLLAALIGLTRPELVSSLVLISCDLRGGVVSTPTDKFLTRMQRDDEEAIEDFFPLRYSENFFLHHPGQTETERDDFSSFDFAAVSGFAAILAECPDLTKRLSTLTMPLLLVTGAKDRIVPPRVVRRAMTEAAKADAEGNISYKILPDAGHMLPIEQPGLLTELIDEHLLTGNWRE